MKLHDELFRDFTYTTRAAAYRALPFSYLASVDSSAKIVKGQKRGYETLVLYLAPSKQSGFDVCPFATSQCMKACLATSGRAKMEIAAGKRTIRDARIAKTRFFHINRTAFCQLLFDEIAAAKRAAERRGNAFAVRLNGTSDIPVTDFILNGKTVLQAFRDVQFYDYTKAASRVLHAAVYANYHITLSYTGTGANPSQCIAYMERGGNAAVVFAGKTLPREWNGFRVIDGDETDLRFLDKRGTVVGLRFKSVARKIDFNGNPFIVPV